MKRFLKIFFLLILFCLIFFLAKKKVIADYASDYQTYLNNITTYETNYNNYVTARATYLAAQNLDAQTKAMAATLSMLQSRDVLTVSYLTALKIKLQMTQGVASVDASSLGAQIDNETTWYTNHNTKLSSAGSLDDLVTDSNDAEAQFNGTTKIAIYISLITIGGGSNNYIRSELTNEVGQLSEKLTEIKANQDKDVSVEERALVDVQDKLARSQSKDSDAKNLVTSITPNGQQAESTFQNAQSDLSDSNLYLKEANQSMLQIITQIKSAN